MLLVRHFIQLFISGFLLLTVEGRRPRSAGGYEDNSVNTVEHIWSSTTVAVGDTAVIHCSFDALFQQLKNGNIDWVKESLVDDTEFNNQHNNNNNNDNNDVSNNHSNSNNNNNNKQNRKRKRNFDENNNIRNNIDNQPTTYDNNNYYSHLNMETNPVVIATGKTLVLRDKRFRVFRPHNSALSVLIIRRVRKSDAGYYRCNLAGSSTRHKYMILNVTDSKIEAHTSPAETRVKVDSDVTLWCNATGYPLPIVYWTREDRNRTLPDGSHQYWGNGLFIKAVTEYDTGVYVCYLDNFVQPVVSYKFSIIVEDSPWKLDGYKMRYDSRHWYPASTIDPLPILGKSYLLMCETRGSPNPQPTIAWYKGREPVASGKNYYIIDDSSDWRQNFVSSTLVIVRYSHQFDGRYVCVANNGFRLRKQKFYVSESKARSRKLSNESKTDSKDRGMESSRTKDHTSSSDVVAGYKSKHEQLTNHKRGPNDQPIKRKHGTTKSDFKMTSSMVIDKAQTSTQATKTSFHQKEGFRRGDDDDDGEEEATGSGDTKQRNV